MLPDLRQPRLCDWRGALCALRACAEGGAGASRPRAWRARRPDGCCGARETGSSPAQWAALGSLWAHDAILHAAARHSINPAVHPVHPARAKLA